jgi:hypothetical protein
MDELPRILKLAAWLEVDEEGTLDLKHEISYEDRIYIGMILNQGEENFMFYTNVGNVAFNLKRLK